MNRITTTWLCTVATGLALMSGCGDDGGNTTSDAASNIDSSPGPDATMVDASPPDASSACLAPNIPDGTNHQYVSSEIIIPTTVSQANAMALDIDGDNLTENQLGEVIALFSAQADLGIQESVDSQVAAGTLLYIANIDSADLADSASTDLRMFLAQDCDSPPVPDDNFSGSELFQIRGNSPLDNLVAGTITAGNMDLGPGNMTVVVPLPNVGNISLPMSGARIVGAVTASGITTATMGGGIIDADVQNILIPALHQTIAGSVADSCTGTATPDCNCDPMSSGQSLVDLFDSDGDCVISFTEIKDNALLSALLAPDLDLFDSNNGDIFDPRKDKINDSLSLGLTFTMVGGQFELPE